jgi:hypothetical protein
MNGAAGLKNLLYAPRGFASFHLVSSRSRSGTSIVKEGIYRKEEVTFALAGNSDELPPSLWVASPEFFSRVIAAPSFPGQFVSFPCGLDMTANKGSCGIPSMSDKKE